MAFDRDKTEKGVGVDTLYHDTKNVSVCQGDADPGFLPHRFNTVACVAGT